MARTMRPLAMAVVEFHISFAHLSCRKAVILVWLYSEVTLTATLSFENTLTPVSPPLRLHYILIIKSKISEYIKS